jgi:hypothetical protein
MVMKKDVEGAVDRLVSPLIRRMAAPSAPVICPCPGPEREVLYPQVGGVRPIGEGKAEFFEAACRGQELHSLVLQVFLQALEFCFFAYPGSLF